MADRYIIAATTMDKDVKVIRASTTLAYADTNEHALNETPEENECYQDLVLEITVTVLDTTTAQSLTIGLASSNEELTGTEAIDQFESAYWETKVITLKTAAHTDKYLVRVAANELNGKYIYTKYAYGADPTGEPVVGANLNSI